METLAVVVMLLGADARGFPQTAGTLPESDRATVGYRSVEAALKALHQKPGVTFRSENGWLIADEDGARTIWSFAPTGHPAYPTVVKRAVVVVDGVTNIQMDVLCEADKVACDNIVIQSTDQRAYQRRSSQESGYAVGLRRHFAGGNQYHHGLRAWVGAIG